MGGEGVELGLLVDGWWSDKIHLTFLIRLHFAPMFPSFLSGKRNAGANPIGKAWEPIRPHPKLFQEEAALDSIAMDLDHKLDTPTKHDSKVEAGQETKHCGKTKLQLLYGESIADRSDE